MIAPLLILLTMITGDWSPVSWSNADAHAAEAKTPLQWSETRNVQWKVAITGLGWSSPVVVGKQVFLTTAVSQGEGLSLRALALSAEKRQDAMGS